MIVLVVMATLLCVTVLLLVASIPLAIEIVTTTTLALGSKELSHHGNVLAYILSLTL